MSETAATITPEIRRNIFSQECLSIRDIMTLMNFGYDQAAAFIRDTKRKIAYTGGRLRLNVEGRLHTQDYLDFYKLDGNGSRYNCRDDNQTENLDL